MKRNFARIPFLAAALLLTAPLSRLPGRPGTTSSFRGEVTDTFCAQSGSHNEMMAKMSSMGRDKETCVKQCTKIGAKYVLYDEAQKRVYKLDDQAKAQAFAGKQVRVSGTLEGDAIRVAQVEALG
jgi:Protein of unknown function (DUF5818)